MDCSKTVESVSEFAQFGAAPVDDIQHERVFVRKIFPVDDALIMEYPVAQVANRVECLFNFLWAVSRFFKLREDLLNALRQKALWANVIGLEKMCPKPESQFSYNAPGGSSFRPSSA